jgi:hypothetical protein
MHKKAALIVLACLFAFTANGEEKVQWIDAMTACPGKDWDDINKDKDTKREFGGYLCGLHGKSYAGEFRCKDNRVEVKCQ